MNQSQFDRDNLEAAIRDAFKDVSRNAGISWSEATVIDGGGNEVEREAARRADVESHWSQLLDDSQWKPSVNFCFLDAIGFRYYLPAAMTRSLRTGCDAGILFFLMNDRETSESLREKLSLLNESQRTCVARFLIYMVRKTDSDEWPDNEWLRVLNLEWHQYLEV